ncbi:MmgE/PrpD family protein [Pseudorhodoferax sp.]|uniref:MmgE/PrpD family protein n=1 Tax=Pseudorhodoferax sp. TaxID=1993553 RepID=UPI002DD682CB|nr:MmgE/PrpD family protein [Pseudorhodoferax sp.]
MAESTMKEDKLQTALAAFAIGVSGTLTEQARHAAKRALVDTLAVSLGALPHPPAQLARKYALHSRVAQGATVWGTGETVTAETATLVNGVPLRGYDYNDFYFGKAAGHPSDIVPGLIALAEWRGYTGEQVLTALAIGYDVCISLFDTFDIDAHGWDYPMLVTIAGTCAFSRLLGLSEQQTREALAIAVVSNFVSDESESHELNARGDLTMWKRFNGSDAIRQAVYACLLAEVGVEGVVRPFEGRSGLLAKIKTPEADIQKLFALLDPAKPLARVAEVRFKRWPVGSRGQSAIQSALSLAGQVADMASARSVTVYTDEMVYDHLVRRRTEPWNPISRETADHSLPYIVTAALLEGEIKLDSFAVERVLDPQRQRFLQDKVKVEVDPALCLGSAGGFVTRVEVTDANGQLHKGVANAHPGHPLQPLADADFEAKFFENVDPIFGSARSREILQTVWNFDSLRSMAPLVALLVHSHPKSLAPAAQA